MENHTHPARPAALTARFAAVLMATLLAAASGLAGCSPPEPQRRDDPPLERPAVLVSPTPEIRAELARAVREALNGAPVRLADDALTSDSSLVVTRAVRRDAAGLPLLGRSTEKPERFELVKRGTRCILIQARTARRWPLRSARCAPVRAHSMERATSRPFPGAPPARPAAPADN